MKTCPEPSLFPGVLPTAPGEGGRSSGGCREEDLSSSAAFWGSGGPLGKQTHPCGRCQTQHTLFKSTFSRADERDFIGIHHVMCSILQNKPEPRELVTRQRALLAGIQKPLLMNKLLECLFTCRCIKKNPQTF